MGWNERDVASMLISYDLGFSLYLFGGCRQIRVSAYPFNRGSSKLIKFYIISGDAFVAFHGYTDCVSRQTQLPWKSVDFDSEKLKKIRENGTYFQC